MKSGIWGFLVILALWLPACGEGGEVQITGIEPQIGSTQGDQPVKITGSNFRTDIGYTVYFGNKKANSVTIMDSSTLVVATPKMDDPGMVDLVITADDGPAWKVHQAFKFEEIAAVIKQLGEGQKKGSLQY